MEAFTRLYT